LCPDLSSKGKNRVNRNFPACSFAVRRHEGDAVTIIYAPGCALVLYKPDLDGIGLGDPG
jgi:hypothetical protein